MNKQKELELNYEMLSDLVKQRRVISEEILVVRNNINTLKSEVERETEYMSAAEYIGVRNSIRRELEVELREQIKQELKAEQIQQTIIEAPSIIPEPQVSESKFFDNNEKIKLDVSLKTIVDLTRSFLKERGVPTHFNDIKLFLEENRNHSWQPKSFNQLMWKIKNEEPRIQSVTRGYYQYKA